MNSLAKTSWMFSSTKRWPTQVLIANSVAFVSVLFTSSPERAKDHDGVVGGVLMLRAIVSWFAASKHANGRRF